MTLAENPMTVAISPSENVLDFSAVWALDMGNKQITIITTNNGSQSAFDYRKYWTLDTKISKTIGSILLDLYQTDPGPHKQASGLAWSSGNIGE